MSLALNIQTYLCFAGKKIILSGLLIVRSQQIEDYRVYAYKNIYN